MKRVPDSGHGDGCRFAEDPQACGLGRMGNAQQEIVVTKRLDSGAVG